MPIDVDVVNTSFFETSLTDAAINLNADEAARDPHLAVTAQQLPVDNLPADFSRSLAVYDDAGQEHLVNFEFRRIVGPMAHFTTDTPQDLEADNVLVDNLNGPTPLITNGDQFVVTDGTNSVTIDFVNGPANTALNQAQTTRDVMDVINSVTNGSGEQVFLASLTPQRKLLVQAYDPTVSIDISGSSASVLGAGGFAIPQDPDAVPDFIYEPDYDITAPGAGSTYPQQSDLPAFADTTRPNPHNWWEMTITGTDALGASVNITQGLLNFNGDGRLNFTPDAENELHLTLASANLPFSSTSGIDVDITRFTQFSGTYQTLELEQNGAPLGERNEVFIDSGGTVFARFTNSLSLPLYRIPLGVFNNPNGLEAVDGTAFRIPADSQSGALVIAEANSQGAGGINTSTLESSNVDIADEFSTLIFTQRVYSLNSQVIQAVNEMTQNLSQLKG